jgi:hypothetical protein
MDQEVIKELHEVIKGLRKIRRETWGDPSRDLRLLPLDEEIAVLEDLVNQMDNNWNGAHPVGQS